MGKELYRVRVVLFVMAENESEARVAATRAQFDIFDCTARKAKIVNPDWKDAIPYNADDERTCSEIMLTGQKLTTPEVRLVNLPASMKAGKKAFGIDNCLSSSGYRPETSQDPKNIFHSN